MEAPAPATAPSWSVFVWRVLGESTARTLCVLPPLAPMEVRVLREMTATGELLRAFVQRVPPNHYVSKIQFHIHL